MKVAGKYSDSSVELEGSAANLKVLAGVIRSADGKGRPLEPQATKVGTAGLRVSSLKVVSGTEHVRVTCNGSEVVISGSGDKLAILAENVEELAAKGGVSPEWSSCHLHIEYHPDHFYLASDSIPLVITKTNT